MPAVSLVLAGEPLQRRRLIAEFTHYIGSKLEAEEMPFPIYVIPILVAVILAVYESLKFEKERERLEEIFGRLERLSKKTNLTIYRMRKYKYLKITPGIQLMRDLDKSIKRMEQDCEIYTPYRLRRIVLRPTKEILSSMENRLVRLEEIIGTIKQE